MKGRICHSYNSLIQRAHLPLLGIELEGITIVVLLPRKPSVVNGIVPLPNLHVQTYWRFEEECYLSPVIHIALSTP